MARSKLSSQDCRCNTDSYRRDSLLSASGSVLMAACMSSCHIQVNASNARTPPEYS